MISKSCLRNQELASKVVAVVRLRFGIKESKVEKQLLFWAKTKNIGREVVHGLPSLLWRKQEIVSGPLLAITSRSQVNPCVQPDRGENHQVSNKNDSKI